MKEMIYNFLWMVIGYKNSLFDNRIAHHIAGGYVVSHISSLFLKRYYWLVTLVVAIFKESFDHFVFGCGGNEPKHYLDIAGWFFGGLSYWIIVLLKRKKYGWK